MAEHKRGDQHVYEDAAEYAVRGTALGEEDEGLKIRVAHETIRPLRSCSE